MAVRLNPISKPRIKSELLSKLGSDKVKDDQESLNFYAEDYTESPKSMPDFVVKATDNDDIIKVLKICAFNNIALIPAIQNTNVGGLCIPESGGIILDMRDMNKIISVDAENKYMIIEPGVSFGQIKEYLDENYPDLRFAYPLSPPHTSVLAGCLMDGLGNLSLRHGAMSKWIQGLEVILSDGQIVKTASNALSEYWFSRSPFPDLTSLFINMQGTTGIVSKMAVRLWDKQPYNKRFFVLSYDIDSAFSFIGKLIKLDICDDIGGITWTAGKMLYGSHKPIIKDENEPVIHIYIEISAPHPEMLNIKEKLLFDTLKEYPKTAFEEPFDVEKIFHISPEFKKFAEFPTDLDFLSKYEGRGLTWIGTYGPFSRLSEGVSKCMDIMVKHNFPPTIVSRPMDGGHYSVLRLIVRFNKDDDSEILRIKNMYNEALKLILDLGFIPYKTPVWIQKHIKSKLDIGFVKLLSKIKKNLDPAHILNPGKWDL